MKTTLLFFGLLLINVFGNAQNYSVQLIATGIPNALSSVFFADEYIGYATYQDMATGGIVKTIDGGGSWTNHLISTVPRGIYFLNKDTGFIGTDNGIYKTINGGFNWANIKPGIYSTIYFTGADTGYASGGPTSPGNGIAKTTDGGNTWFQVYSSAPVGRLYFRNSQSGYGGTGAYPWYIFFKSNNGGNNWLTTTIPGLNAGAACFYFADSLVGFVGEYGKGIYKTIDGGSTWTNLNLDPTFGISNMHFINAQKGIVVGGSSGSSGDAIIETVDGGSTWTTLYSDSSIAFTDVHFPNSCTGYAAGWGGMIARLDCITGINESGFTNNFNIFPNPTGGLITLTIPSTANEIAIVNSLGQIVEDKIVNEETSVNFTLKQEGIYFVRLTTEEGSITKKLVVCK